MTAGDQVCRSGMSVQRHRCEAAGFRCRALPFRPRDLFAQGDSTTEAVISAGLAEVPARTEYMHPRTKSGFVETKLSRQDNVTD